MIEVKNAVMRFDDKNALDGVSLTIPEAAHTACWVLTEPENQRCSGRFPGFTGSAAESFS